MPLRPAARVRRPSANTALDARLPPGQIAAKRWPVLHQGEVPPFDPTTWDLRVFGRVARPLRLSWEEFGALPQTEMTGDLHCVTRWSKLDNSWRGVALNVLLEQASPTEEAAHLLFHCDGGYTANLALEATDELILLATHHDGAPLTPEHGYPLRVLAPERYAWKSAKWLRGIEVLTEDRPGFWERYGYHNEADAWREERFAPEGDRVNEG
ncbi:MAG: sulfite oxidase-like oxidoreductase [Chloroflexota bacterium]|nr:sulfite oxidase-like oxidoreductase [Chloroflexota bacterium]